MHANSTWSDGRGSARGAFALSLILIACSDEWPPGAADGGTIEEIDASAPAADATVVKIDRSHLKDLGSAPLDYADPALWTCKPGNDPNECLRNLDVTELLKDGSQRLEPHRPAQAPSFDCFYVYPTVDINGRGNTNDFTDVSFVLETLRGQAARFSRICEVYAPLYRQRSFDQMGMLTGDEELAYADVERALLHYLAHFNRGRKFAIIAHSQGTGLVTRAIAKHVDGDPELRARLVSAALIGGQVLAPEGRDVGGTFQHLPLCATAGQVGCVIAFASFAKEMPPSPEARTGLGRSPAGSVNGCTNPSLLAGNPGRYRGSYLPVTGVHPLFVPNLPANPLPPIATAMILVRDLFKGECIQRDGLSYLEISPDQSADDRRPVPPYRYTFQEQIGAGLHTGDFSVVLDDLIDTVALQAQAMH